MTYSASQSRTILIATVCVLVVLVGGIAVARATGLIHVDHVERYVGLLFGSLLVVAGNALPKLLRPSLADDPNGHKTARRLKAERFAGWTLVLGGLASMALWVWAPEDIRTLSASGAGLTTYIVVLIASAWLLRGKPFAAGRTEDALQQRDSVIRRALFQILNALAWSFAMFMASDIWGTQAVLWLVLGFTVSMSLLDALLTKFKHRAE
jgi:hypothetical protein